ncbi:MAG: hypothetical protein U0271_12175 [Polyangiaceae bacterium]
MTAHLFSNSLVRTLAPAFLASLALTGLGCDSDDPETNTEPPILEPPAPGEGVQFVMNTTIDAASEVEHCKFVKAPPEGLLINHDEVRFTTGSHHFLLYSTPYADIPTQNERGETVDTSGVFDCSDGATNGWRVTSLIGGSQNASGESIVDFPSDVAMRVPGNAVLLMNAHYINASSDPIEPEVRINLFTIPESQLREEGGLLFWYNIFIRADAQSSGRAMMECAIPDDIHIVNTQSHMHARGVDYSAEVIDPEGASSTIYENTKWEGVPVEQFDPELEVKGGSKIRFHCDYDNPASADVYQGPRSTDEMCMYIASYYPANAVTSLCSADAEDPTGTNYLGADWIGQGTATCTETLSCISSITAQAWPDFLNALTDCVLASDPEKSQVVSDGVRCLLLNDNPQVDCMTEIQACVAAG